MKKMVDMALSPQETKESMAVPTMSGNRYPYGLSICLCNDEIEKLGLDDNVDVGDMLHLFAMGKVTSVSKNDTEEGARVRVEIQLTHLGVEDEDDEEMEEKNEIGKLRKRLMRMAVKSPY